MFLNSKRLCVDERALEFIGLGCGGYVWQNRHSFRALQRSQANLCVCVMLQGGNDYEIYCDPRTIGHEVSCPEETLQLCQQLFFSWERERERRYVNKCQCMFCRFLKGQEESRLTRRLLHFPQSRCCGQSLWCLYLWGCFVVCFCRFHSCLGSTIFTITAGTGTMTHITRCVLSDFPPECYKAAHVRVVSSKKRQKWYHSSIESPTGPEHAVFIKHAWHLIDRRETVSEKWSL